MVRREKKSHNQRRKTLSVKAIYSFTVLMGLLTLAAFFYPTVSDAWNRYVSSLLISEYIFQDMDDAGDYEKEYEEAVSYNEELYRRGKNHINEYTYRLTEGIPREDSGRINHDEYYETQLNGSSMMGYIEIPRLNITLPFDHYATEEVLSRRAGHLYGSSLPVGGRDTHAVLTAHTGMMEAKHFTDIDKLETGDHFIIHVLDRTLGYRVDQILTVLPDEMEALSIEEGEDYVTLLTCTPYGINSHRLLVRGSRDDTVIEAEEKTDMNMGVMVKEIVNFPQTIFVIAGIILVIALFILIEIWRK